MFKIKEKKEEKKINNCHGHHYLLFHKQFDFCFSFTYYFSFFFFQCLLFLHFLSFILCGHCVYLFLFLGRSWLLSTICMHKIMKMNHLKKFVSTKKKVYFEMNSVFKWNFSKNIPFQYRWRWISIWLHFGFYVISLL